MLQETLSVSQVGISLGIPVDACSKKFWITPCTSMAKVEMCSCYGHCTSDMIKEDSQQSVSMQDFTCTFHWHTGLHGALPGLSRTCWSRLKTTSSKLSICVFYHHLFLVFPLSSGKAFRLPCPYFPVSNPYPIPPCS